MQNNQPALPLSGDHAGEMRSLPVEVIDSPSKALVERAADGVQLGSLSVADPGQVVVMAQKIAEPLAQLIEDKRLFAVIGNKKHVYVEGWATCGAMLGVVPRLLEEHEDPNNPGEFIATVEAVRSSDGMILGRAKASCGCDEREWGKRSRQARRSMAQTRATGKVFRLLFSWVMQLAGYETTPFEEMDEPRREPDPMPDRDPSARRSPTRQQRANVVTTSDLDALIDDFERVIGPDQDFKAWAQKTVGRSFAVMTKTTGTNNMAEWTHDDLAKCRAALGGG